MASPSQPGPPLPTRDQCFSLSEEQCHRILVNRDPNNSRANKTWELAHQPELVRLYMTMISFPQVRDHMKTKLDYCYKTYANRYKDWHLPVDRCEREQAVRELFALVSDSRNFQSSTTARSVSASMLPIQPLRPHPNIPLPPLPQHARRQITQQAARHPARQTSQASQPSQQTMRQPVRQPIQQPIQQPYCVPQDFLFPTPPRQDNYIKTERMDYTKDEPMDYIKTERMDYTKGEPMDYVKSEPMDYIKNESADSDTMSIATVDSAATWSTGSAQSAYSYFDDTFSNHRFSISTMASSVSSGSRMPKTPSVPTPPERRPLQAPKHDPRSGYWNDCLQVVPCGRDHSNLRWNTSFPKCSVCGFTQWHALMVQARSLDADTFVTAMIGLRDVCHVDFAGNHSLHYLMSAGVGMDYYTRLLGVESCQNVFGQNPLHVLNPQDLGYELITLLEWFKGREHPPGLLLTQRDCKGRTPMHMILQHPLERRMYAKVLEIFPYVQHQLRSFDTSGRTAVMLMSKAAVKIKSKSAADYARIQVGITETKLFQSTGDDQNNNRNQYGFHDIARGARGTSYIMGFFECRICGQTNTHSNSYLDQMICACKFGRDRNGPDDTGTTAAHALITQERCNDDPERTPESPSQTCDLIKVLIPRNDTTLREALHVLDREGQSLVYNIATRGLDEILQYVLELEDPSRRKSMVNFCVRDRKGTDWSVLASVIARLGDTMSSIKVSQHTGDYVIRQRLVDKSNRLTRTKHILLKAGAEMHPSITTRFQIYWP